MALKKNAQYLKNYDFSNCGKIAHYTKAMAPAKWSVWIKKLELLKAWDKYFSKFSKIGHYARAIVFGQWSIWVKYWNCWKHMKNLSKTTSRLFHARKRLQKHLVTSFPKSAKLATMQRLYITSAKWSVWAKHLTSQKHTKNNSRTTLEFFYAKSDSRNHPLDIRKMRRFQNSAKLSTLQRGHSV